MTSNDNREWPVFFLGLGVSLAAVVLPMLYDAFFPPKGDLGILFLFTFTVIPLVNLAALAVGVSLHRTWGWGFLLGAISGMILTALYLFTPVGSLLTLLTSVVAGR